MTMEEIEQRLAELSAAQAELNRKADEIHAERKALKKAKMDEINRIEREKEELSFRKAWEDSAPTLNEKQARRIWAQAWEDDHSSGYEAVQQRFGEIADVCLDVIKAA